MSAASPFNFIDADFERSLSVANAKHREAADLQVFKRLFVEITEIEIRSDLTFAQARDRRLREAISDRDRRRTYRTAFIDLYDTETRAAERFNAQNASGEQPRA